MHDKETKQHPHNDQDETRSQTDNKTIEKNNSKSLETEIPTEYSFENLP